MFTRMSRRAFLKTTALATAGLLLPRFARAEPAYDFESLPPLRKLAEAKGLFFGAAIEPELFRLNKDFSAAIKKECNLIVPENALKWRHVHPEEKKWTFRRGDALLSLAQEAGMKMRGHALVWPGALPAWVVEGVGQGRGAALLEEHIGTVLEHYRGEIFSWDVVNEALEPLHGLKDGHRRSPLFAAMGPGYIDLSFRLAAQADPKAQLVYNDFLMEADPPKAQAVLNLLRGLKDRGVPVHAVGLQAHLSTRKKLESLEWFCKGVKDLGLELLVTELDVWESVPADTDEERDRLVADKTRAFLDTIFSVMKPRQILTWGISDRNSWLSNPKANGKNKEGRLVRGLPLDEDFRRKPMWRAIYDVMAQA